MAGTKEIKRRIKSIKSTKKITKAMELVSASKMRKAVSSTLHSRLYAEYSWEILTSISKNLESITNPIFTEREVKNILLILITSSRGLCGAYDAQIIKKTISLIKFLNKKEQKDQKNKEINIKIVTIGKKGDIAMRRVGQEILASFMTLPDNISISDIIPISELSINEYNLLNFDKVLISYTDFVSPLVQKPNIKQIIPISKTELKEFIEDIKENSENAKETKDINKKNEYLFEGDKEKLIESLAQKLIRMQIYQMILESNASEQSSRMLAMKNASEAALEMIDDLTLAFNKARQAGITREISEISAGMASIN